MMMEIQICEFCIKLFMILPKELCISTRRFFCFFGKIHQKDLEGKTSGLTQGGVDGNV